MEPVIVNNNQPEQALPEQTPTLLSRFWGVCEAVQSAASNLLFPEIDFDFEDDGAPFKAQPLGATEEEDAERIARLNAGDEAIDIFQHLDEVALPSESPISSPVEVISAIAKEASVATANAVEAVAPIAVDAAGLVLLTAAVTADAVSAIAEDPSLLDEPIEIVKQGAAAIKQAATADLGAAAAAIKQAAAPELGAFAGKAASKFATLDPVHLVSDVIQEALAPTTTTTKSSNSTTLTPFLSALTEGITPGVSAMILDRMLSPEEYNRPMTTAEKEEFLDRTIQLLSKILQHDKTGKGLSLINIFEGLEQYGLNPFENDAFRKAFLEQAKASFDKETEACSSSKFVRVMKFVGHFIILLAKLLCLSGKALFLAFFFEETNWKQESNEAIASFALKHNLLPNVVTRALLDFITLVQDDKEISPLFDKFLETRSLDASDSKRLHAETAFNEAIFKRFGTMANLVYKERSKK